MWFLRLGVVGRWGLVVVAAGLLGWSAWAAFRGGEDPEGERARERDRVLAAGRQQLAVLNSMDPAQADGGLRQWLAATTGPLHDQLERDASEHRRKIQEGGGTAVGTVLDAAVTALDVRAGNARVIASVRVEVTPRAGSGSGAPSVQRRRYEAGLTRTPAGWKLKSLTILPVGTR